METTTGRVLSIQSHTVHGYVGNKSAVLPLQLLGFDVDPLNSVQFSNHTGYANGFKGQVLHGDELLTLIQGLKDNDILKQYTHLLTGYIGSETFLSAVLQTVREMREASTEFRYVCDPVLGDHGKLYVPKELVQLYRDQVVPLATVITPNQFECELLTGITIRNESDAHLACATLHAAGVETVVITSMELEESSTKDDKRIIAIIASTSAEVVANRVTFTAYKVEIEEFPMKFTGTGDLTATLLLAWTSLLPKDFATAIGKVCASVQSAVKRTFEASENGSNPEKELLLVQSRHDIMNPPDWPHVHGRTVSVLLNPE